MHLSARPCVLDRRAIFSNPFGVDGVIPTVFEPHGERSGGTLKEFFDPG